MENTTTTTQVPSNQPKITEVMDVVESRLEATELVSVVPQPSIPQDPQKLLNALYWIWDAFERTGMPFFLVYQTAKDVLRQKDLSGDKVEVGVRRVEWISGGRRILDAFVQPIREDEDTAYYEFEGVPVVVHVYEDHDCIRNTDSVLYRYESFKLPNTYKTFEEVYG